MEPRARCRAVAISTLGAGFAFVKAVFLGDGLNGCLELRDPIRVAWPSLAEMPCQPRIPDEPIVDFVPLDGAFDQLLKR